MGMGMGRTGGHEIRPDAGAATDAGAGGAPAGRRTRVDARYGVQLKASGPGPTPRSSPAAAEPAGAMRPTGDDPFALHLPVQRAGEAEGPDSDAVHRAAAHGVSGGGGALPHLDAIQRSFGRHDVSHVSAHVGGVAAEASQAMNAQAYAVGNQTAFRSAPDLHTAAHEAAHVVQQRAGVHLKDGVGQAGDHYERHADAVADRVVRGESAETLLDEMAGGGGGSAIQMLSTSGGAFDTTTYAVVNSGQQRGCTIELTFTPNDLVVAPKIGLTQTVKSTKDSANYYAFGPATEQAERQGRANSSQQGNEGGYIDRSGEKTNPMYGLDNPQAGKGIESVTSSSGGNARVGHRTVSQTGQVDVVPAYLYDQPKMNWPNGKPMEQLFETTALAMEGDLAGTYFGSVEWGVDTDTAGTPTLKPFKVVSQGVPSSQFMASASNWNAQQMFVRDRVVAPGNGTIASLEALTPGQAYPKDTLMMTITTGSGSVDVKLPIAATFESFLVSANQSVTAGKQLAVYGNKQDSADLPITDHVTVDPTTLDDKALEKRMRELCDEILNLDKTAPSYQNKRFELRSLGKVAVGRATDTQDSGHTYTVKSGDTLWDLAEAKLAGGANWTRIMALNAIDLQDPYVIKVGAVLKMPKPYTP